MSTGGHREPEHLPNRQHSSRLWLPPSLPAAGCSITLGSAPAMT